MMEQLPSVLDVKDLTKTFSAPRSWSKRRRSKDLKAVNDVNLTVRQGETLGLVGESGCGKTTLGRCILRAYRPTSGEMIYTRADGTVTDLAAAEGPQLRRLRTEVRTIFQDPVSSLNPRMTIRQLVGEPLRVNRLAEGEELDARVAAMLRKVGLRPEYMRRYPHAFSGGERQRIGIARALITEPRLVIADEAVSALDVSVRSQILNLLEDLQEEYDLTYIFISHDLSVIQHLCDRVGVMYVGRIVEMADTEDLFRQPRHPYTEALLRALPVPDPRQRAARMQVRGEVPDPADPPTGCAFHPRCNYQTPTCAETEPPMLSIDGAQQQSRCLYAADLDLAGSWATQEPR